MKVHGMWVDTKYMKVCGCMDMKVRVWIAGYMKVMCGVAGCVVTLC